MLGNIIGIEENTVLLKLNIEINKFENLINIHVIMEDEKRKIIGEITDIKENIAYINYYYLYRYCLQTLIKFLTKLVNLHQFIEYL